MLIFLINAIKIIFLLGFLILIHESGHFFVAKLCKVKVNEFAIGFGPKIWSKKGKETKYTLRLFPLGGFVNMEGEEERSENEGSFSKASIPRRIAIVLAGAVVNIVFGLVIYFALATGTGNYISNEIASIENPDLEYIQAGDEIVSIDGKKIRLKSDIDKAIQKSNGEELSIVVKRDEELITINETPIKNEERNIGIYFKAIAEDEMIAEINAIVPNSPAEEAGLQSKDIILSINGESVGNDPYKVIQLISLSEGILNIEIQRKEETIQVEVEPQTVMSYSLGIMMAGADNSLGTNIYYGFWDTVDFSFSIIDNLKLLLSGNVGVNQLMGPIGISETVAETQGFTEYVYIIALISLSLGVTNLLPFPPLDGGKVVILIIEGIRRKPLKESIELGIQSAGFFILIALSIFVAYNDILRLF